MTILNWYLLIEITGELNLALQDLLVDCHGVVIVEGVDSGDHLVGEDAECPPVDWFAVALVEEDLGCQVFGSTTESVSARLAILGETKVCQFQISLLVDQNVLWFEISVDNIEGVQVFEHETDLGGVEPRAKLVGS